MPDDSTGKYDLLDRLADEVAARCRRGEKPSIEEYCHRHPELAAEIREVLPALVEMEGAKGNVAAAEAETAPVRPSLEFLGDYRILREIGRGGMGVVYEAQQLSLGRRVALKLLTQRLVRQPNQIKRFEREARAAARLHHTNIVPVFGSGEHEGVPYYVMQFIQGTGLDVVVAEIARLEDRPSEIDNDDPRSGNASAGAVAHSLLTGEFAAPPDRSQSSDMHAATLTAPVSALASTLTQPPGHNELPSAQEASTGPFLAAAEPGSSPSAAILGQSGAFQTRRMTYWQGVARIGVQVASALEYAHRQGVVHRDVKPSNLLLDLAGTAWVTDFGLAKAEDSHRLTGTGDVLGTLRYMPPEAFEGKADARSDVFSLGLTLYELLALQPAFDERDRNKLIRQASHAEALPLGKVRRGVPRDLETVVHRAIEREPARRYQTAQELGDDLQRFINDEPILARRQTTAEAAWRWTRQHKALAALAMTISLVLVSSTIGSIVLAAHFRQEETDQRGLVKDKNDLIEEKDGLILENQRLFNEEALARRSAELTLADMMTDRGFQASEQGRMGLASLWFAHAAKQSASDPSRQAANHLRAQNWFREAIIPVGVFSIGQMPEKMTFQPGNDRLLIQSGKSFYVWDYHLDKCLQWANGCLETTAVCWSPDGAFLAIGFSTGEVQIRNLPDGKILQSFSHPGSVRAIAYSPDGRKMAVASDVVKAYKAIDGTSLWEWRHPDYVFAMVFNAKGDRLATACRDKKARVFAVFDRSHPAPLFQPVTHVLDAPPVFVDADRGLITVPDYQHLNWWDVETGNPSGFKYTKTKHSTLICLAAARDGRNFAVGCDNNSDNKGFVEIWNTADRGKTSLTLEHSNRIFDIAFNPLGSTLLTGCLDHNARLWSLANGKPIGDPLAHMAEVHKCAISTDDRLFATARIDGQIRIWKQPVPTHTITQQKSWGNRLRVSPNGQFVVPGRWHETPYNGTSTSNQLTMLDSVTGKPVGSTLQVPDNTFDSCVCVDNRTLAALSLDGPGGYLSLWDSLSGRRLFDPVKLSAKPQSVASRPGRPQVAVLCQNDHIMIYDICSGTLKLNFAHPGGKGSGDLHPRLEYTEDGSSLISIGCDQKAIHVWDAETGQLRFPPIRVAQQSQNFTAFCLSKDSKMLATVVNMKNEAQVWDLQSGHALCKPLDHPGHFYGIFNICFSQDGRYLLTGAKDGQTRLWDWKAEKLACPSLQHDGEVWCVALTPDGRYAVTGNRAGRDATIRFWELTTGKEVSPPIRTGADVTSLTIASGGASLFAFSGSGSDTVVLVPLRDLVTAPERPIEALEQVGELTAAQRIELGGLSSLTVAQWLELWDRFHSRYPDFDRPTWTEIVTRTASLRLQAEQHFSADRPLHAIAAWRQAVAAVNAASDAEPQKHALSGDIVNEARQKVEAYLSTRTEESLTARNFADFLLETREPVKWTTLMPTVLKSTDGTTLSQLSDHSIMAIGTPPEQDTYLVETPPCGHRIATLRLEALPHYSLPNQGPGREANGNFELSEISIQAANLSGSFENVPLVHAAASYTRPLDFWTTIRDGPHGAIGGTHSTRWDVANNIGRPSTAYFDTAVPIEGNRPLRIRLDFRSRAGFHTLGCFRLAVTSQANVARYHNLEIMSRSGGSWVRLGIAWLVRDEVDRARAAFVKAAARSPTFIDHLLMALAYQALNEPSLSDKSLDAAMAVMPENFTDPLLGYACLQLFGSRLTRDPNNAALMLARFRLETWRPNLEAQRQNPTEALDWWTRARKTDSTLPVTQTDLKALTEVAKTAYELRKWKLYTAAYSQITSISGAHQLPDWLHFRAGHCYVRLAMYDKAAKAFERDPGMQDNKYEVVFAAAASRLLAGDEVGYRKLFTRLWETNKKPKLENAYLLAYLAALSSEPPLDEKTLIPIAIEALRAGDKGAWATYAVGLVYLRLGKYDESIKLFEESLNDRRDWPAWHREHNSLLNLLGLAIANYKANRIDKAQEWWCRAEKAIHDMDQLPDDSPDSWPLHPHFLQGFRLLYAEAQGLFAKK